MNRREIDAVERDDLEDAFEQVLLPSWASWPRIENREPSREELNRRYRLEPALRRSADFTT